MRTNALKLIVVACLLVAVIPVIAGCDLAGRKWFVPFGGGGVVVGYLLGTESERTTVERFCYENGEPVDCSEMPEP